MDPKAGQEAREPLETQPRCLRAQEEIPVECKNRSFHRQGRSCPTPGGGLDVLCGVWHGAAFKQTKMASLGISEILQESRLKGHFIKAE
jgi:hypothetical protein